MLNRTLEYVLISGSLILLVPTLMLLAQCLAGARRYRLRPAEPDLGHPRPSVDILIPAHNEVTVLAATIESIRPQLAKTKLPLEDRLLVVADNCTDGTAALANSLGAEVIERCDERHRAKGYAIAAGLDYLSNQPRDVVVMIDADCVVSDGAIESLARCSANHDAPVQACYAMPNSQASDSWGSVSAFAVTVKNHVRPLGLKRLGFGCLLTGSGMAFPAAQARLPNWASDNIVEDMKTTYDLMIAGHSPRYCPDAVVTAGLPANRSTALEQRKRWEHGHLHTIVTQFPRLLIGAFKSMRLELLVAALDLMIPPLSLLVQLWTLTTVIVLVSTWCLGLSFLPLAVVALTGGSLMLAIFVAWITHGRDDLSVGKLCMIPIYVATKVPLYVTAVLHRQRVWNRTTRESEGRGCT